MSFTYPSEESCQARYLHLYIARFSKRPILRWPTPTPHPPLWLLGFRRGSGSWVEDGAVLVYENGYFFWALFSSLGQSLVLTWTLRLSSFLSPPWPPPRPASQALWGALFLLPRWPSARALIWRQFANEKPKIGCWRLHRSGWLSGGLFLSPLATRRFHDPQLELLACNLRCRRDVFFLEQRFGFAYRPDHDVVQNCYVAVSQEVSSQYFASPCPLAVEGCGSKSHCNSFYGKDRLSFPQHSRWVPPLLPW